MPYQVSTADEIFSYWLNRKADPRKLERNYAGLRKEAITSAEYVKSVEKQGIFYFRVKISSAKGSSGQQKTFTVDYSRLKAHQPYYENFGSIPKTEWKERSILIPYFADIQSKNCPDCGSTGKKNCKVCKGEKRIQCKACNGKGKISCTNKECRTNGHGSISVELDVKNPKTNKITKTKLKVPCPICHGENGLSCPQCGSTGKVICRNCSASGGIPCSTCKGTGKIFSIMHKPVSFQMETITRYFYDPRLNRISKKDIEETAKQVEGIEFRDIRDLNEKTMKSRLGWLPTQIKPRMNECRKAFESLQRKRGAEQPLVPIIFFPIQELRCVTAKGRRFSVYAMGSANKMQVFSPDF